MATRPKRWNGRLDTEESKGDVSTTYQPLEVFYSLLNRFRWAVCQLHILRNLRPDAATIRLELSNLPRTLDDTYERIFLAIPEEDRPYVHHAFHWMVYHNDLFSESIPLSTLLEAVQHSIVLLSPPHYQWHNPGATSDSAVVFWTIEGQHTAGPRGNTWTKNISV